MAESTEDVDKVTNEEETRRDSTLTPSVTTAVENKEDEKVGQVESAAAPESTPTTAAIEVSDGKKDEKSPQETGQKVSSTFVTGIADNVNKQDQETLENTEQKVRSEVAIPKDKGKKKKKSEQITDTKSTPVTTTKLKEGKGKKKKKKLTLSKSEEKRENNIEHLESKSKSAASVADKEDVDKKKSDSNAVIKSISATKPTEGKGISQKGSKEVTELKSSASSTTAEDPKKKKKVKEKEGKKDRKAHGLKEEPSIKEVKIAESAFLDTQNVEDIPQDRSARELPVSTSSRDIASPLRSRRGTLISSASDSRRKSETTHVSERRSMSVDIKESKEFKPVRVESEIKDKKKRKGRKRRKDSIVRTLEVVSHKQDYHKGLKTITLSPETQTKIGCLIGEQVTTEKPWIEIRKERIELDLDEYEGNSDFSSVKDEIKAFPLEDIMIGYDSTNDTPNQFILCVTMPADTYIRTLLDTVRNERQKRVQESIFRPCRKWLTFGSEAEIDELKPKDSRPMYEVEAEADLYKLMITTDFSDRDVDGVVNGYTNLLPGEREHFDLIARKRTESGVQACAQRNLSEAQTPPPLPLNSWTQYEFVVSVPDIVDTEVLTKINGFLGVNSESLSELMQYNGMFDLFKDDYPDLILNKTDTRIPDDINYKDYQSFSDMVRCKDKYISAVSWHPMWSGIVACAYVDNIRTVDVVVDEQDTDEVLRAVHGTNPVLIWSFVDPLGPKLILGSPREVHALKFCPFNENILIGGCMNGQIVIWDLTDKLRKVEEEIILTLEQQMYRKALLNLISWMKDVSKREFVRPAAMSSLEFSPTSCITDIQWLSPYHQISLTGRYGEIQVTPLQFLTSSEDGTVCIWDMQARSRKFVGMIRPRRKKKRQRPAALEVGISQYKPLHMIFTPIFKISVIDQEGGGVVPLSALSFDTVTIEYMEREALEVNRKISMSERLLYDPIFRESEIEPKKEFYVGTTEGHVMRAVWEGYEFSTGEIINSESCTFETWGEIHEAPVSSISRSPFIKNLVLTVSAKVFAIWSEDVVNIPLLWRRSHVKITRGVWSEFQPSTIILSRVDGSIESWDFMVRTDSPFLIQSLSGKVLTGVYPNKLGLFQNAIAVTDHNGSLRVLSIPDQLYHSNLGDTEKMVHFFNREKELRDLFQSWQKEWRDRHASILRAKEEAFQEEIKKQEEEIKKMELLEEEKRSNLEAEMRRYQRKQAQAYMWTENAQERWKSEQEKRYIKVILGHRNLNKRELLAKQEPLMKIREQEEKKKVKQEELLRQRHKIFGDTVNILFPEMIETTDKAVTGRKAITEDLAPQELLNFKEIYEELETESINFINEHPFKYDFGWMDVFSEGKERLRTINEFLYPTTKRDDRHQKAKIDRKLLQIKLQEEIEEKISARGGSSLYGQRSAQLGFILDSGSKVPLEFDKSSVMLFSGKMSGTMSGRTSKTSSRVTTFALE